MADSRDPKRDPHRYTLAELQEAAQTAPAARQGNAPPLTQGQTLRQVEFTPAVHTRAQELARRLGYKQFAYASTSDLWGYFCLPENPEGTIHDTRLHTRFYIPPTPYIAGCIIVTRELGLLFVSDLDDLQQYDLAGEQHREQDPHCTCSDCIEWHRAHLENPQA